MKKFNGRIDSSTFAFLSNIFMQLEELDKSLLANGSIVIGVGHTIDWAREETWRYLVSSELFFKEKSLKYYPELTVEGLGRYLSHCRQEVFKRISDLRGEEDIVDLLEHIDSLRDSFDIFSGKLKVKVDESRLMLIRIQL